MKILVLFLSLLLSFTLHARSENEAINLSLASIECEETLPETEILDKTLEPYRKKSPFYQTRYEATREKYKRIEARFIEEGIPSYFALIPYVESHFNPKARGYKVAGYWQFSKQSARNYGLKVTKEKDERLDPELSTEAAIRYIKSLKEMFGSWYLADFAYAMGEGKLKKLIAQNQSDKLSDLLKDPHFPKGTKAHFATTLLLDAYVHNSSEVQKDGDE